MIAKTFRIVGRSCLDFLKDDGMTLAASLSYFTMMALAPFCLFLITVFGHFLGHYPGFYAFFLAKLGHLFPAVTQGITNDLAQIIQVQGLGKFSLLLYGVLSYQVFSSLEKALNTIFKVKKKRGFIPSVLVSLVVVSLIIALLTVSFTVASMIPLIENLNPDLAGLGIDELSKWLLRFVVPFALVLSSTMLLYVVVPKTKVGWSAALGGALFTAVLLEIAKNIFTWYIGGIAQFGKIYGPLTAFIVFLLWMFYSSCILLIGAEIAHNSRKSG